MVTWWHGGRWTNCTLVYRVQTLRPGRKLIWLYVPRLKKSAFTVVNCQDLKDEAERVIGCIIEVNVITEGKRQLGVVIWSKGYKSTTVMQKTWHGRELSYRSLRLQRLNYLQLKLTFNYEFTNLLTSCKQSSHSKVTIAVIYILLLANL